MDALLTLSSKGQLVIPARLRQLLGLKAGDLLVLNLEPDGLRLIPQDPSKTSSARALIGCTGYSGPALGLDAMDPALIDLRLACFVPVTVVIELEWLLRGACKLPPEAVLAAFKGLMAIRHLHLEQEDLVIRALEAYQQGIDFADALHLLRSEGCSALISFDRSMAVKARELNLQLVVQHP